MKRKQTYVAPRSEALSVETKGVLCGSGDALFLTMTSVMGNGNPEEEWTFVEP